MKTKVIFIVSGILLIGLGLFTYSKLNTGNGSTRPIYFVPNNAAYIIETSEPISAWKKVKNNPLWNHLLTNKTFKELSSGLNAIDEIISYNELVFDLLGSRKLLVSAHMYKRDDYDFLYLMDVESTLETNFIETILKKVVSKEDYKLTSRTYKENTILELYDKEFKETLYISSFDNILIASYVNKLVESSLDEYENPVIGRNLNFIEVTGKLDESEFFNIYLNYSELPKYANIFLDEEESIVNEISKSLFYSGLAFELDDKGKLELNGTTNVNDTLNTFLNALNKSGNGKSEIASIAPDITSFYLSLGFENFQTFVNNFEETYSETDSIGYVAYQKNNNRVENLLGINLKENFYSWIDDEVVYLQLQSGGLGSKNEFAFFMKSNDIDDAKSNLEFIKKQIKKKTPGKFKSVNYKGYAINYLSIKGFFKAIMGKFLSKLEKPYYVILNDYVIFSNHPQTLRIIIDRFQDGKILNNDENYEEFASQFSSKNNVMCYMHMSKLYSNLIELSDLETQNNLNKNKEYITCFEEVGFQMANDNEFFTTSLRSSFKDPSKIKIEENLNFRNLGGLTFDVHQTSEEEDLFATIDIVLSDFDIKLHEEFYDNDMLKVEAEIKNGLKDGVYKQFYEDGTLMLKGHFENDLKEGVWKFHNSDGKVVEKRSYKAGDIE